MQYSAPVKLYKHENSFNISNPVIIYGFKVEGLILCHLLLARNADIKAIVCDAHIINNFDMRKYLGIALITEKEIERYAAKDTQILLTVKFYEAVIARIMNNLPRDTRILSAYPLLSEFDLDVYNIPEIGWQLIGTTKQTPKQIKFAIDLFIYENVKLLSRDCICVPTLDVVITEKCSLRCLHCANLMQYYEEPVSYKSNQIISWVKNILSLLDKIGDIHILGGEPFLHEDLSSILYGVSKFQEKIGRISIFTNGTIIPTDDIIKIIKELNIFVSISDYGKISKNKNKLISILSDYGCEYEIKYINEWQKCGYVRKKINQESILRSQFDGCCAKDLLTVHNGKLFICPFAAGAHRLEMIPDNALFSYPVNTSVYKSSFYEFLSMPGWKSGICAYCPGRHYEQDKVVPAIQISKSLKVKR